MTIYNKVADSGKREEFSTGSLRDTRDGKGRFDLIPVGPLKRLARHYENGAKKYGEHNWEKGQPSSRYWDSAMRHLVSYMEGDRSEDHLAAVAWNAFGMAWNEENRPDLVDIQTKPVAGIKSSVTSSLSPNIVYEVAFGEKQSLAEPSPIKIALVGKKATGKSRIAVYLVRKHHFKNIKMQGGIDRLIHIFYSLKKSERPYWETRWGFYDALYKVNPNIHIEYLKRRLELSTMPRIVVDDPRYVNEVKELRDLGFTIVRVNTPDGTRQRRIPRGMREAAEGSVKLTEYFTRDPSKSYIVDFNIINENWDDTKASVDDLIKKLEIT